MRVFDAYGHVSLPRFLSASEYLKVMDENGVKMAMVCTAETCPDLGELSRAAVEHGERFRVAGLPLGDGPAEIEEGVAAQMDSGFIGVRIPDSLIAGRPGILDVLGKAGGIPFVVGSGGFPSAAAALCGFLDKYPDALVCGPHFAGGGDPEILSANRDVARLFDHPRFAVIFSRHGAFERERLLAWAMAVVARVGWGRIMYGSEYPVALFRDETYASTVSWIDSSGLNPGLKEKEAFLGENARRLIFEKPVKKARPLDKRWCRMDLRREAPVWLFTGRTLDVPEDAHRKLLEAYLKQGGEKSGSYRDFVTRVLVKGIGIL